MSTAPAGELRWAVVARFAAYVRGMSDGTVEAFDGAHAYADGTFGFAADAGTAGAFRGSVRFRGHYGFLDLVIARPRIVERGAEFVLIVDDEVDGGDAIEFARGNAQLLHAGGAVESRLTPEGSELFFGRYPVGYRLDPFTVGAPPAPDLEDPGMPPPASRIR